LYPKAKAKNKPFPKWRAKRKVVFLGEQTDSETPAEGAKAPKQERRGEGRPMKKDKGGRMWKTKMNPVVPVSSMKSKNPQHTPIDVMFVP